MPHRNQIDLDFYLKSLEDYNTQYGIGTNNGGNYEVRSSPQAPGFGYVNPETNNLFQFPQQPGGANASGFPEGSFENFIHNEGYNRQRVPGSFDYGPPEIEDAGIRRRFQTPMNIGDPMPVYTRFNNIANQPDRWGADAWFDQGGGFAGYGDEEIQKRFQKSLLGAMKNAETV